MPNRYPTDVNVLSSALLTDWYQLTMLQAYVEAGMEDTAVFEFFVRNVPPQRKFFMAAGRACRKKAEGKETWPGPKRVYRNYDPNHRIAFDVVTVEDDRQGGEALIHPVMKAGTRLGSLPSLAQSRDHAADQFSFLPDSLEALTQDTTMEVRISEALQDLARQVDRQQGV